MKIARKSSPKKIKSLATAFAPASIGNVAVGFDILGLAIGVAGDVVSVEKLENFDGVEVAAISGIKASLPTVAATNTAGAALLAFREHLQLDFGFRLQIKKGIALGSGMGGSAASAVAAVVAANSLLKKPLPRSELLGFALVGEEVASGSVHPDNIAPSLLGGLTLIVNNSQANSPTHRRPQNHDYQIIELPLVKTHFIVLIHPHTTVETKTARKILKPSVSLSQFVNQTSYLGGFVTACYQRDEQLLSQCLRDIVIEPQRAELIPGFYEVQRAALQAGALGCSISGSGPSVFAWAKNKSEAKKIAAEMSLVFSKHKISYDSWISPISSAGARLIEDSESFPFKDRRR